MEEEDEYRRRLAGFAEVLGRDARTLSFNQLKELIREIDKYGNKIARTIARRGHHSAPKARKGRVDTDSNRIREFQGGHWDSKIRGTGGDE